MITARGKYFLLFLITLAFAHATNLDIKWTSR